MRGRSGRGGANGDRAGVLYTDGPPGLMVERTLFQYRVPPAGKACSSLFDEEVSMDQAISDAQQIEAKINGYIKGCETGEEAHLKASFHPDARMFGAVGADRYDVPVMGGMSTAVAAQPVGPYDARILSIDVEGDAAAVKLAESGFWGHDFIDFFLLARIEGEWQIVAKSFTVTGNTT